MKIKLLILSLILSLVSITTQAQTETETISKERLYSDATYFLKQYEKNNKSGNSVQTDNPSPKDTNDIDKERLYNDATALAKHIESKGDTLISKATNIISQVSGNVWDIMVTQQRVKSVGILCSILAYFAMVIFFKERVTSFVKRAKTESDGWHDSEVLFTGVGFCILVGLAFFNVMHFQTMLTGFMNPKYGALVDLFNTGTTLLNK